jgi:hyperosmotically inducible periplasmic protein
MRMTKLFAALAAAMIMASGCSVMRGQQGAGDYVDDAALTARVKAALIDDETVKAREFNVDVYQGAVTLSGTANSNEERDKAASIARQVPGVKSVNNSIRVASSSE